MYTPPHPTCSAVRLFVHTPPQSTLVAKCRGVMPSNTRTVGSPDSLQPWAAQRLPMHLLSHAPHSTRQLSHGIGSSRVCQWTPHSPHTSTSFLHSSPGSLCGAAHPSHVHTRALQQGDHEYCAGLPAPHMCHSCQAAACVLPAGMVLAKPRLGPPSLHCCACKRMVTLTLGVRLSV